MRPNSLAALAVLVLALSPLRAAEPDAPALSPGIGADEIRGHVRILAGDAMEGRRSGTPGGERAAEYVAARFGEIGLRPAGDDGTFLQWFDLPGTRLVAGSSGLSVRTGKGEPAVFAPEADFLLFGNSSAAGIEGAEVVFAGYGVSAPQVGWDDWAGLDARGKVVLILRHGPGEGTPGYRFAGRDMRFVTFEQKARTAASRGAAAVVIVNDSFHHPDEADALVATSLSRPLPIPFLFARAEVGRLLLAAAGRDLDAEQRKMDAENAPRSGPLAGVRIDLRVSTEKVRTANVVGLLPGADPKLAAEAVVIGGHYDHLGRDGMGALDSAAGGEIRNGADDNASGTAGVIELAEHFALASPRPKRTLVFVAFAGEELGLLGSAYYVGHPAVPLEATAAMLNFDMIGRSRSGFLFVGGTGTSPAFGPILDFALGDLPLAVQRGEGGAAPSDNTTFFLRGVPTLFFFAGMHPDYHRATDDWEKINVEDEARILTFAARVARAVADLAERPEYVRNTSGGFGIPSNGPYLGVQLDPDQPGEGARIGVVVAGTPAEKAGLSAGDVVVGFGDAPVPDAGALVGAIGSRKAGDKVILRVLRDGSELRLEVTLGGR